jgi:hypothetical protein
MKVAIAEVSMRKKSLIALVLLASASTAKSEDSMEKMPSYPINVKASDAREFQSFAIEFANLKLRGDSITVVPISTEQGITGAVLIGDGDYSYAPEAEKKFDGRFHTALLRFNPKDAESIIKFSAGKKTDDKGASELAQVLIAGAFRHCYHRGKDALIPPEGALAADLYSRELGDVLISVAEPTIVVHNFTDGTTMYEKK